MSTYLSAAKITYSKDDINGHICAIIAIFEDRLNGNDYNIISMDDEPCGVRVWRSALKDFVEEIHNMTEEEWKEMLDDAVDDAEYFDREEFQDFLLNVVKFAEENKESTVYIFNW